MFSVVDVTGKCRHDKDFDMLPRSTRERIPGETDFGVDRVAETLEALSG